jgi:outer membrane lipoprotein-sorting protein
MKNYITPKMYNLLKKLFKKNYALNLCIVFFYILTIQPTFAQSKFLNQYPQELAQIENFLNNIKNLSCRFIQNSNGNTVEGKFYLSRNKESSGKMRIEYLAEPKVLIVVNGAILSYQDIELDEVSRLSTNTTPASFLTRPNISFSAKDVEITKVTKSNNEIKVSVMKKNRKEAGEFSLIFKLDPFEFVKMEVKNDLEQIIAIQLKNIDFQSKISDKLFTIKNNDNE